MGDHSRQLDRVIHLPVVQTPGRRALALKCHPHAPSTVTRPYDFTLGRTGSFSQRVELPATELASSFADRSSFSRCLDFCFSVRRSVRAFLASNRSCWTWVYDWLACSRNPSRSTWTARAGACDRCSCASSFATCPSSDSLSSAARGKGVGAALPLSALDSSGRPQNARIYP